MSGLFNTSSFGYGVGNSDQGRYGRDLPKTSLASFLDDHRANRSGGGGLDRYREMERRAYGDDNLARDNRQRRSEPQRERYVDPMPRSLLDYDDRRQNNRGGRQNTASGGNNWDQRGGNRQMGRQDNRDGYNDNRGRDNRSYNDNKMRGGGGSAGNGLLGARPEDNMMNPLQGISSLGGLAGGLTGNLSTQQQQQLMSAVQTQSLLAVMQAQAQLQNQLKSGILPTPGRTGLEQMGMQQNRGGSMNYNRQRNLQQMQQNRKRPGQPVQYGQMKRDRPNQNQRQRDMYNRNRGRNQPVRDQSRSSSTSSADRPKPLLKTSDSTLTKKTEPEKKAETSVKETKPSKSEEVTEEEMRRSNVNLAGQDVDRLLDMLYHRGRKCYVCKFCKIICNKPTSMRQHLYGKKHCLNVAKMRGETLKIDEEEPSEEEKPQSKPESPKQESKPEEAVSTPDEEMVKYFCDTKKTAIKQSDVVTITSVTEAQVVVKDFTSRKNMFGFEFVKAVSGFKCRLCKTFIRCGNDVIKHIKGKKHYSSYQAYIAENKDYEENQLQRNEELFRVLSENENKQVLLYEVIEGADETRETQSDDAAQEHSEIYVTKFVPADAKTDSQIPLSQVLPREESMDVDADSHDQEEGEGEEEKGADKEEEKESTNEDDKEQEATQEEQEEEEEDKEEDKVDTEEKGGQLEEEEEEDLPLSNEDEYSYKDDLEEEEMEVEETEEEAPNKQTTPTVEKSEDESDSVAQDSFLGEEDKEGQCQDPKEHEDEVIGEFGDLDGYNVVDSEDEDDGKASYEKVIESQLLQGAINTDENTNVEDSDEQVLLESPLELRSFQHESDDNIGKDDKEKESSQEAVKSTVKGKSATAKKEAPKKKEPAVKKETVGKGPTAAKKETPIKKEVKKLPASKGTPTKKEVVPKKEVVFKEDSSVTATAVGIETRATEKEPVKAITPDSTAKTSQDTEEVPAASPKPPAQSHRGQRGGRHGKGAGRGRGRGRRSPRVSRSAAAVKEERDEDDSVDFMAGYQVIDEVADDE